MKPRCICLSSLPENWEHFGHLPNGTDLVFDHLLSGCSCIGLKKEGKYKVARVLRQKPLQPLLVILMLGSYELRSLTSSGKETRSPSKISSSSFISSSSEQMLSTFTSISVTEEPMTTRPIRLNQWAAARRDQRAQVSVTFFPDERQGPGEDVHEVGKPVGVRRAVELSDVHHVVFILKHGGCGERR